MFGKSTLRRFFERYILRRGFTLLFAVSGSLLPALIVFALWDFVSNAQTRESQVQSAALKSELAQFVLGLREEDGSSLLDDPDQLSKAQRPLTAVLIGKPFFTYFLNRGNAKLFEPSKHVWEPPKACALDFPFSESYRKAGNPADAARACLAIVPNEPTGRYVYFSIRYPTSGIARHVQGQPFSAADHITLDIRSRRSLRVELVFEPSVLAASRYPSQKRRFAGIHEIAAYQADDPRKLVRSVQGQAFERVLRDDHGTDRNYVTALVRIDASLVDTSIGLERGHDDANSISAAVAVYQYSSSAGKALPIIQIEHGTQGESLVSLEKLYVTQVPSRARLEVTELTPDTVSARQVVWSSDGLLRSESKEKTDFFQRFSDWWANQIVGVFYSQESPVVMEQEIRSRGGLTATLANNHVALPDIATRSFFFLTLALLLTLMVSFAWWLAARQLTRITRSAYEIAVSWSSTDTLSEYTKRIDETGRHTKRQDEVGRLARTFNLLISRSRSRNEVLIERMKKEEADVRAVQEQVRTRQSILIALGHELKSPLQALLSNTAEDSSLRKYVDRMSRAVETLDLATSIEAAFENGKIVVSATDLAKFLSTLASNMMEQGVAVSYQGPASNVIAVFDPIALDTALSHLIDNARRYQVAGTEITISLNRHGDLVKVEVFNYGPSIPEDQIDAIFNLGVTERSQDTNRGQGLFVTRAYIVGMKGSIRAENRERGVAFITTLAAA